MCWILGSVFEFREMFLDSGTCLDSGKYFWFLGSTFGFWEVFSILGRDMPLRATVEWPNVRTSTTDLPSNFKATINK